MLQNGFTTCTIPVEFILQANLFKAKWEKLALTTELCKSILVWRRDADNGVIWDHPKLFYMHKPSFSIVGKPVQG